MRIYSVVSAAVSGILMVGVSTVALAGSCGGGVVCNSGLNASVMPYEGVRSASCNVRPSVGVRPVGVRSVNNCNPGVVNHGVNVDPLAPVNSYSTAPYGYLKTFAYKNTPNVNVMRVHTRGQMVPMNAAPTGFSGGCNPVSTGYCRTGGTPVAMPQVRPLPMPQMRAPMQIMGTPIMRAPVAPVQVRTGQGYNPANFAPRQYGSNVLTPGTAHIPTSIVDRSPITHIDGVAQQQVSSVTTVNGTYGARFNGPRPVQPQMRPQMGGNVIGHVSGGSYTYKTAGTPDYWEKTSGATVVDGLPATQILCRRGGAPGTSRTVNVVRPVIGVPRPVPTAVRVPVRPVCGPVAMPQQRVMQRPMPAQMPAPGGRWAY